jgi:hypothetical protein
MGGFMGYFVGGSSYEISTDNRMRVREWYSRESIFGLVSYFTTTAPEQAAAPTDYTT